MNTVYIINSLEGGGAERVFADLITMLSHEEGKRRNLQVILLDKKHEAYSLPAGVMVHRIGHRDGLAGPAVQFFALLKLLRRLNPELIVSFLTRANILAVLAAKWIGCSVIISERSNTSGRLANRFVRLKRGLVSAVYRKADCVIAVSKGVADCLISEFGVSQSKVVVLNNPVDLERINNQALSPADLSSESKIVAMGRLVKSKGFDDLIRAYANSGLSCGLVIMGEGPERARLARLVSELGLVNQVEFSGFVSNPYKEIKQAGLFVLCSHLEGFPNALVEAMALQKAVIATDCADGPREILCLNSTIPVGEFRQADFGLMVNVGDHQALAKALVHLSADASLRSELASKGRHRVKQFSKQNFYHAFLNLVGQVKGEPA